MNKRQRKKWIRKGNCPVCENDHGVFLAVKGETIDEQFRNMLKNKYSYIRCSCGYELKV